LLIAVGCLLSSVGCARKFDIFAPPTPQTREEAAQTLQRGRELRAQLETRAAQGDPYALVTMADDVGPRPIQEPERIRRRAYLERAAATGAGVGLAALGRDLLTSGIRTQLTDSDLQRGLNLLRQAAKQGCQFGGPNSSLVPHAYLAGYLEDTNPEESDLWYARKILHCGSSNYGMITSRLRKAATPVQFGTEGLAWNLLAKPNMSLEDQRKNWPLTDYFAAGQRAEQLRRAVRETEKEFPPPPRVR
jgi:hypothetical protein